MPPPQPPSPILKEVVVAAWRNDTDDLCGLGCMTPFNEQDPNLMFTVLLDEAKERIFAKLGLSVMVKGGGSRKKRCFDFLVPLYLCNAGRPILNFHTIDASDIDDESVKTAVNDARLTKSGKLIQASFSIGHGGAVVTPWKEEARFSTCSDTSLDLLCGLLSLSESKQFVLYMCPSGYAEAGLTILGNVLQTEQLQEWSPQETGVYGGRNVMAVSREHVEGSRMPRSRAKKKNRATADAVETVASAPALPDSPPPYNPANTHVPCTPPPDIFHRLAAASPSHSLLAEDSAALSDQGSVPEKAPAQPKGAIANVDAGLSGIHHLPPTTVSGGKRKRALDAEQSAVRHTLTRRFETWLALAFGENARVYEHTILLPFFAETVPGCVAACDPDRFDVGIAFATAVVACDPRGGECELYWEHQERFWEVVDDVRALVLWILQRGGARGEEEEVLPWRKLMELGEAARERLRTGERGAYDGLKARVAAGCVLKGIGDVDVL